MISKKEFFLDYIKNSFLSKATILLAVIFSFGFYVSQLGLYGSHWNWVIYPDDISPMYGLSRWITIGLIQLIGANVIFYHLLNFALLFVTAFLVDLCLKQFRIDPSFSLAVSLLFIVFPAFTQIGGAFSLTILLLGMIFTLFSILFYQRFFQQKHWIWFFCGGIFSLVSAVISTETAVFVGLTSFVIFLCNAKNDSISKIKTIGMGFFQFISVLILTGFLAIEKNDLTFQSLISSLKIIIDTMFLSWRKIISYPSNVSSALIYVLVIGLAIIVLFLLLKTCERKRNASFLEDERYLIIALLSFSCGAIYIVLLRFFSIPVSIDYPFNAPSIVIGIFASLFILSLIRFIFIKEYQLFLMALLIGLSGGTRLQTMDRLIRENNRVMSFLGQMQVRGDTISEKTAVLVEQLPFEYTSRESIEALIRRYMGNNEAAQTFHIIPSDDTVVREFLGDSDKKTVEIDIKHTKFLLDKDNIVAIWWKPNDCLKVLDRSGQYDELPEGLNLALKYSKPELIRVKYMSDVLQLNRYRTTIEPNLCFSTQLIQRFAENSQWKDILSEYSNSKDEFSKNFDFNVVKAVLMAMIEEEKFDEAVHLTLENSQNQDQKSSLCVIWKNAISLKSTNMEVITKAKLAKQQVGCQ